jgi:hypothetical protein
MRTKLENGMLMIDVNSKGWNPEEVIEMSKEQYKEFRYRCVSDHDDLLLVDLRGVINVLVDMAKDGIL